MVNSDRASKGWLSGDPLLVARIPLLPLEDAVGVAHSRSPGRLRDVVADEPWLLDAIEVASPSLRKAIAPWLSGDPISKRALSRLKAYVVRAGSRPTPFGLFAGLGLVDISIGPSSLTVDRGSIRSRTRPDMRWLYSFRDHLYASRGLPEETIVYANPLRLRIDDRIHIWRSRKLQKEGSAYRNVPSSLRASDAVLTILETVRPQATICKCLRALTSLGLSRERAEQTVAALIDTELLLTEDNFSLLGDPWAQFLQSGSERFTIGDDLRYLDSLLNSVDSTPVLMRPTGAYRAVSSALSEIHAVDHIPLQTDCVVSFQGALSANLIPRIEEYVDIHLRASSLYEAWSYRTVLQKRLEGTQRFLPLLNLMTSEAGFHLQAPPSARTEALPRAESRRIALVEFISQAIADETLEVDLSATELRRLLMQDDLSMAPDSFETAFHIGAKSLEALNSGQFTLSPAGFVASFGAGDSAMRFSHALPELSARIARLRTNADAPEADILFEPPLKFVANVMVRTLGAPYHIPLGVAPAATSTPLDPAKLYVGIVESKLQLWSEELRSFVNPVQANMVATDQFGPDFPRLLAALAHDGLIVNDGFMWLRRIQYPFVPRLRHNCFVLNRAFWNVPAAELAGKRHSAQAAISNARKRYRLPDLVYLAQGDQMLLVSLEDDDIWDLLRDIARTSPAPVIRFEEVFPSVEDCWLRDSRGKRYNAEFVVSGQKPLDQRKAPPRAPTIIAYEQVLRTPGSDWFYVKWYCGIQSFDRVLRTHVDAMIQAISPQPVDWHFVRYTDTEDHLRLRFRFSADYDAARRHILTTSQRLADINVIWAFDISTYQREVERYGGTTAIELFEHLFTLSSSAALSAMVRGRTGRLDRIEEAALSFHRDIISSLPHDILHDFISSMSNRSVHLTEEERKVSRRLSSSLGTTPREKPASKALEALIALQRQNLLDLPLAIILDDLLHMQFNRFGVWPTQELIGRKILSQAHARLQHQVRPNAIIT